MKRKITKLALLMLATIMSTNVFADSIKIKSKDKKDHLKSLVIPFESHVVQNGVYFECFKSGTYEIEQTDDDGNVVFVTTIYARAGRTYFIYIPGLNPDEDVIE